MEEETGRFLHEREDMRADMLERQRRELEEFDLESSTMGLDALSIRDDSEQTYMYDDVDTMSTRGSMVSLTPSSSTNSFLQMQQQQQLVSQSTPSLQAVAAGGSRSNSVDQSRQLSSNSQLLRQPQTPQRPPHRTSNTTTQL